METWYCVLNQRYTSNISYLLYFFKYQSGHQQHLEFSGLTEVDVSSVGLNFLKNQDLSKSHREVYGIEM